MENYVITISRKFGSRGHEIAGRLSELLGVPYYDKGLVEARLQAEKEKTAKVKSELPGLKTMPLKAEEGEQARGFMSRFFSQKPRDNSGSEELYVFEEQSRLLKQLASEGSCIILGRCSDLLFKDCKRSLNVFIYAPDRERIANCMRMLHTDEESARAFITSQDRARLEYRMRFFKGLKDELQGRQLLIDSSVFGVEESARILERAARYLFFDDNQD